MMIVKTNVKEELWTEDVERFSNKAKECIELYAKKNHDYGNSFEKGCNDIGQVYAIGRLYDKMNRLVNVSRSESEVKDESVEDTLKDLACYSLMYLAYLDKTRTANIPDVDFE
nr:MAG TPA: Nucleotide modification associated domain 1 [Crassvirales sp.]